MSTFCQILKQRLFYLRHLKTILFYNILIILMIAVLSSCATQTNLTSIWEDETYTGDPFTKILVVGIAKKEQNRREFEKQFTDGLAKRGIEAIASADLIPPTANIDKAAIKNAIEGKNVQAVIVTRLLNIDDRDEVIPGQTQVVQRTYYDHLYQSYRKEYAIEEVPNSVIDQKVIALETNLYSVESEKLVYSAQTETIAPSNAKDAFKSFCKAIIEDLYDAAFID